MNQTFERIEFNLHTAASDDASIITPKEAVRKARSLGQTAFAVTSLNSVQDYYELEKEQEKADKDKMLAMLSKLIELLNKVNDGSFVIDDRESERIKEL